MKNRCRLLILLIIAVLCTDMLPVSAAPLTSSEKEQMYSAAILDLETYLETYGKSGTSLWGIEQVFGQLGGYEQSRPLMYYTQVLSKIEKAEYTFDMDLLLDMLENNSVFNDYLHDTLKGSAIQSVKNLKAYATAREMEFNGRNNEAIEQYRQCLSFFDADSRYYELTVAANQDEYDNAMSMLQYGDYAGGYFALLRISNYGDSADRAKAIVNQLGYTPKDENDNPEDVRDVIRQELLAFRDAEDAKEKQRREDEERKAAEEAARAAEIEKAKKEAVAKALNEKEAKENEPQALSAEDIRRIIAEEFAKQTPAEEPKKPSVEPQTPETFDPEEIRAMLREEIRAAQPVVEEKVPPVTVVVKQADPEPEPEKEEPEEPTLSAEEVRSIVRETLLAKEEEAAEPEPEPAEPQLTADDVRQIIAEAFAAQAKEEPAEPEPEPEPAEPQLTADDVRSIIAEALANFNPQPAPQPQPTTIVVNPAPVVVQNEPAPEEAAVEQPLEEPAEDANKIIRIPFPTRMVEAEDEMRANYNELKSEILAYGVKSRVSNSGDTFRLHKVTFVKITIAGKSLKLYFALDPKDYENTSLPIQDASHKNIYKDIPLVFKVKSELSMRRAKQLISDVMEKHGLEQGRVELRDHADSLKDYVAAGTKEVEDDEE